jgi:hypothetical protein
MYYTVFLYSVQTIMGIQDPTPGKNCYNCEHIKIEWPRPFNPTCLRDYPRLQVIGRPEYACCSWGRATGWDDKEKI